VTGAGGYVGGCLVGVLRAQGQDVHGIVRDPAPQLDIEQTVCDLATVDAQTLEAACRGAEVVVHLAGEDEVMAARQPAAALASTVVATERLVEAAHAAGVMRLIYMSTVHVYGERMAENAVLTEDLRPEPRSTYAVSRLASEHLAATFNSGASELIVFRLTNSVGAPHHPGIDRWTLVANDLCRQGATSGHLRLRSSGMQWRDFVALADVCSIVAAASEGRSEPPPGTYNLGSGQPTTVRRLAEMIQDAFERHSGIRPELHAPDHEGRRPDPYRVSVERLAERGLEARTPLAAAVEETVRFCLDHREVLP
jgi:UDP-glucose 4-epimerase